MLWDNLRKSPKRPSFCGKHYSDYFFVVYLCLGLYYGFYLLVEVVVGGGQLPPLASRVHTRIIVIENVRSNYLQNNRTIRVNCFYFKKTAKTAACTQDTASTCLHIYG